MSLPWYKYSCSPFPNQSGLTSAKFEFSARDMDSLFVKRSQTLVTNAQYVTGTEVLTSWGSDFLWAVFAVMATTAIVIAILSFFKPAGERTFYYLNVAILSTATISYYSLACSEGLVPIATEFNHLQGAGVLRQVSYVRYIDWFVTTPLLLAELLLTSGMPTNLIISAIFADIAMVVTGLVGALTVTTYKWGYFAFGCFAMFYVFAHIFRGFRYAARIDKKVTFAYTLLSIWLVGLWFLYPVAWGLCEGGNVISVNGEMLFYGILDLLAKPVFAIMSIVLHLGIDERWLGLNNEPRMLAIDDELRYRSGKHGREKDTYAGRNRHDDEYSNSPPSTYVAAPAATTSVPASRAPVTSTGAGIAPPIDGTRTTRV